MATFFCVPVLAQKSEPRPFIYEIFSKVADNFGYLGDSRGRIATLIDFSLPSTAKRIWVINLDSNEILFNDWVAHGRNSGDNFATEFSNVLGSNQSSLGVFLTGRSYNGSNGLSLRLSGMEPGFNDLAEERAIVIHGADYVSAEFIQKNGRLGRSLGCPAVSMPNIAKLIELIEGNTLVFAYYPQEQYMNESQYFPRKSGAKFYTSYHGEQ